MIVEPRLKPDLEPCSCGCLAVGRPRARAWKDGLPPHARNCECRRCKAPNYRRAAAKRERQIAKDTGGERQALSGALCGADVCGPFVDIEETANADITRGIRRWWESKGTATKVARLMARSNGVPKCLVLSWDRRRRVVVMTYDSFRNLCQQRMEDQ